MLLIITVIISVFIFYKPVLAIFAIVFYGIQIGIYLFNDYKPPVKDNLVTTNKIKKNANRKL